MVGRFLPDFQFPALGTVVQRTSSRVRTGTGLLLAPAAPPAARTVPPSRAVTAGAAAHSDTWRSTDRTRRLIGGQSVQGKDRWPAVGWDTELHALAQRRLL